MMPVERRRGQESALAPRACRHPSSLSGRRSSGPASAAVAGAGVADEKEAVTSTGSGWRRGCPPGCGPRGADAAAGPVADRQLAESEGVGPATRFPSSQALSDRRRRGARRDGPERCWRPGRRQPPTPGHRGDRFGGVSRAFGADSHLVQGVSAGLSPSELDPLAQPAPRGGRQGRQQIGRVARGLGSRVRFSCGRDELIEQRGVGRRPEDAQEFGARLVPRSRQGCEGGSRARAIALREGGDRFGEPSKKDIGVADLAELIGQAGQIVAERSRPLLVEKCPECPQVRAKAAGRHARLVNALGVLADSHRCVVEDQPRHRAGDGAADRAAADDLRVIAGTTTSASCSAAGPSARPEVCAGSSIAAPASRTSASAASMRCACPWLPPRTAVTWIAAKS